MNFKTVVLWSCLGALFVAEVNAAAVHPFAHVASWRDELRESRFFLHAREARPGLLVESGTRGTRPASVVAQAPRRSSPGAFPGGEMPPERARGRPAPQATTNAETNWKVALEQARLASRTNAALALALCDRAVAVAGTNPLPWLLRASLHDGRREFEEARRDASGALQRAPQLADAWQLRGMVHFKMARFRESVSDFDQFLQLAPARRAYHWQRGISLYYAGKFDEGRRQFELHESVNPDDVENAVWHFLCVARAEGVARARAVLLKPGPDPRVPMRQIHALFAGRATADEVLAAAQVASDRADALFYAHLYLGLYFDVMNDWPRAREHIAKAVEIGPAHYMGDVARVQARILPKNHEASKPASARR